MFEDKEEKVERAYTKETTSQLLSRYKNHQKYVVNLNNKLKQAVEELEALRTQCANALKDELSNL